MFRKRKIPYIKFLPVIILAILAYNIINNYELFFKFIAIFIKIIFPVILGFCIAFFLNPLLMFYESKINHKKKRSIGLLLTYITSLGLIIILIRFIAPTIVNSFMELAKNLPYYLEDFTEFLTSIFSSVEIATKDDIILALSNFITTSINQISATLNIFLTSTISTIFKIGTALLDFVLGTIISIYVLKDKEKIGIKSRQILRVFLEKKHYDYILYLCSYSNHIFSRFVIGKFIDSLIIALICFVGLFMFDFEFVILITVIVGVTNMIPYFGPFIGAVPAVILTLFDSPTRALWMALFIFILQQFDGLYLGPKILGDQVGLSPLLVLTAILIGGGFFGFVGMFIGVPILAILKGLLNSYLNRKLEEKELAERTS